MSTWDEALAAFAAVRAQWGEAWDELAAKAELLYADKVRANWESYKGQVEEALGVLQETRTILVSLPGLIDTYASLGGVGADVYRANLAQMQARYDVIAAGTFQGARPLEGSAERRFGVEPFIVGAVVLTLLGVCFALVAWEYTRSLHVTALAQRDEIQGRIEAMRNGKTLQPSTQPSAPPDADKGPSWTGVVFGGLLLVGIGAAAWAYSNSRA